MIVRDPKFLGFYVGTRPDPITNRAISNHCWNQHHDGGPEEDWPQCRDHGCQCLCHDSRIRAALLEDTVEDRGFAQ